jgi:hypothetical protein
MGFSIEVDEPRRRILIHVSGVIHLALIDDELTELQDRGFWSWPTIIDLSEALALDVSDADARSYATRLASLPPRGPVAFIASSPQARAMVRGLLHEVNAVEHPPRHQRHIVDTIEEAHEWLNLLERTERQE